MDWFKHWFLLFHVIIGNFTFICRRLLTNSFVTRTNVRRNPFQSISLLSWFWLFLRINFWLFILVFVIFRILFFDCRNSYSWKLLFRSQFDKPSFIISWKFSFWISLCFLFLLLVLWLVKAFHLLFLTWTFHVYQVSLRILRSWRRRIHRSSLSLLQHIVRWSNSLFLVPSLYNRFEGWVMFLYA